MSSYRQRSAVQWEMKRKHRLLSPLHFLPLDASAKTLWWSNVLNSRTTWEWKITKLIKFNRMDACVCVRENIKHCLLITEVWNIQNDYRNNTRDQLKWHNFFFSSFSIFFFFFWLNQLFRFFVVPVLMKLSRFLYRNRKSDYQWMSSVIFFRSLTFIVTWGAIEK